MRVLVVDDSVVFRSQIKAALEGVEGIMVTGTANNGRIALQKLAQSSIDLVTLDMEMPEMSGLETIREIRKAKFPVRIIVFSSHTTRGSEAALDALAAGADDFVAKPSGETATIDNAATRIKEELLPKILQFFPGAAASVPDKAHYVKKEPDGRRYQSRDVNTFHPEAIVIGSSTGGPPALEKVLADLRSARIPILIAQHMPPLFTASLAKRLSVSSGIAAAEARNGEEILPNRIYVAPGNFHLSVVKRDGRNYAQLDQKPQRNSVRPAVDVLFESAADVFGRRTMAIVLTGMGEDGLQGARMVKEKCGGLMIQDRESCVVFGMPGAIFGAGIQDEIGSLDQINAVVRRMIA